MTTISIPSIFRCPPCAFASLRLCVNFFISACVITFSLARAEEPQRPNIIFILADDLGYGDLGCYGQKQIKTPNLDKLADEGIRFTRFYAGSTVCAPSRCAFMTGYHMGHARIRGNKDLPLQPDDFTAAEALALAGYHTGLVGKWGLGDPGTTGEPKHQGFDESFGFLNQTHAHTYYPDHLYRNGARIEIEKNKNGAKGEYVQDRFTEEAKEYIRRNGAKDAGRPFFLYLAFTAPHANNELGKLTGDGNEVPSDAPYSDRDWPQPEKNFAAMVTRLDASVGEIMTLLREMELDSRTLIFFSSDNGPHHEGGHSDRFFESSGGLRGSKRDLYEGGIRVPMIVRWKGKIAPHQTSDQIWAAWDFLPTISNVAGIEPPYGIDGVSLLPTLLGQSQPPREFLYWEFHEGTFKQAAVLEHWKAVIPKTGGALELYDLKSDPSESRDVSSEHLDIAKRMGDYIRLARTPNPNWPTAEEKAKQP